MITMKKSIARMFLAVLFAWCTSMVASAQEWEIQITASTPNGAENSLYFGQKTDATDGYDSRYEVRAMLGADIDGVYHIKAYFSYSEWDVVDQYFWRDIKAPDQTKSWVFEVDSDLSEAQLMLKWDPLKIPEGYAVELTDMDTSEVIDMASQNNYSYTDTGPRQFTINSIAPPVDTDGDGIANDVDTDDDNDGVEDPIDDFPLDATETVDTDGDGIGNNADTDDDNDGVEDTADALPHEATETVDTDGDGIGNNSDTDDDNDGVEDTIDAFPLDAAESVDTDGDGIGNYTDRDDDNDGVVDTADAFPRDATERVDTDGDGIGNNADTDDDGDNYLDTDEIANETNQLSNESVPTDNDGDFISDLNDTDDDNDGVLDTEDAFVNNAAASIDTDLDGLPDAFHESCDETCVADSGLTLDLDDDNDGVEDTVDAFAHNAAASLDTDGDGQPDSFHESCDETCVVDSGLTLDLDDDNDGVEDTVDAFVNNAAASVDTDGDEQPDTFHATCDEACITDSGLTLDTDDDNDGIEDTVDALPLDSAVWDTSIPVITLLGEAEVTVNFGETYQDAGATALDNLDGDISSNFVVTGSVDTNKLGTYTLAYNVVDAVGNQAASVTRIVNVVDNVAPVITLPTNIMITTVNANGVEATHADVQAFVEGARASDNVDGELANITNNIPEQLAIGVTTVTFSVSDSSGNQASATATITVELESDIAAPVLVQPTDVQVEADGELTSVTLTEPTFTDKYPDTVVFTLDNSGPYPLGETLITWTATDGSDNISTISQTVRVVDTTAPTFDEELGVQTTAAKGKLTTVDVSILVLPSAFDIVDGEVDVTLLEEYQLASGVQQITWLATDSSGNSAQVVQTLHINPLAEFYVDGYGEIGTTASIGVVLSGEAPIYPVTLEYHVAGDADLAALSVMAEGNIVIDSGMETSFNVDVYDNGLLEGEEIFTFTLTDAQNSVVGSKESYNLTVIADNEAPTVSLIAEQQEQFRKIIFKDKGEVTLSAIVNDINQLDVINGHSYEWFSADASLIESDDSELTFTFDPSTLEAGSYDIELTITETRENDALSSTDVIRLFIEETPIVLDSDTDSDNDGISDEEEGVSDSDGDGILDYLDDSGDLTELPIAEDNQAMQTVPGLKLAVGQTVLAAEGADTKGAAITEEVLAAVGSDNGHSVDNAKDNDHKPVSHLVDFEVSGLTRVGQTVAVVLPLPNGKQIPNQAVYRKYTRELGWQTFVPDGEGNAIASAHRVGDFCPAVGSELYLEGLNEGEECIKLTIIDGGPYDADGEANGKVRDPGYIAAPNLAPIAQVFERSINVDENNYFTLNASNSYDQDGDELSYSWQQLTGTPVLYSTESLPVLELQAPDVIANELLEFEVTVSDGGSVVSTEQVDVNVTFINQLPTLSLSSNLSSVEEDKTFVLTASASDIDQQQLTYQWQQVSGANAISSSIADNQVEITAPSIDADTILVFSVTVSDGIDSVTEEVRVTVTNKQPEPEKKSSGGGSIGYLIIWLLMLGYYRRLRAL